jgi:hypothetical protein
MDEKDLKDKIWKAASKIRRPAAMSDKIPSEDWEQTRLHAELQKLIKAGHHILYYAIPNGGWRNKITACRLKATGVQPGVPDRCLPVARSIFHGLYIEMKRRKGGQVSRSQKDWIEALTLEGYRVEVCRGWEEALAVVRNYFGIEDEDNI